MSPSLCLPSLPTTFTGMGGVPLLLLFKFGQNAL